MFFFNDGQARSCPFRGSEPGRSWYWDLPAGAPGQQVLRSFGSVPRQDGLRVAPKMCFGVLVPSLKQKKKVPPTKREGATQASMIGVWPCYRMYTFVFASI